MDNLFLEVFPDTKLDSKINELASECKIIKISKSSDSKTIRIFIDSKYLISGKYIEKMEKALVKSYFTEYESVDIVPMLLFRLFCRISGMIIRRRFFMKLKRNRLFYIPCFQEAMSFSNRKTK